ncbi:hypothetical protein BpHYR1_051040 [Brachionus plicatilis]|uniref:Uncharacterized protein n=1 Tax=Brachionus plicatilis TaxID=10195 RepID=A0A3M7SU07_BRAPC|nr:hypothetical protein BpHYR1_051040 [Brachionus plicatilis]
MSIARCRDLELISKWHPAVYSVPREPYFRPIHNHYEWAKRSSPASLAICLHDNIASLTQVVRV